MSYTGLADGLHTFEVRDVVGGVPDPTAASYSWRIDTTPPDTILLSGPTGTVATSSAEFTFESTEIPSTFRCSLDGEPYVACTSPVSYTSLADGPHQFRVYAIDALMNFDLTPAVRTWTVDTTAPDTTIVTGPPALTNATTADFTFSATEPAVTFECRLDGGAFAPCTNPVTFIGLAEGAHVLEVRALDAVGNADLSPAIFGWTIDVRPPETSFVTTPPALSTSSAATFAFEADESPATFECQLDGGSFVPCVSPSTFTGLADGAHELLVRATDPAGNTDPTPASFRWSIDTVAPDTLFVSTPAVVIATKSATFVLSATESPVTFQCSLDTAPFLPCLETLTLLDLPDGMHEFRAIAVDSAGNTDPTPAAFTFTVDTQAPNTVIEVAPPAVTNLSSADFQFGSTENGVTFECALDGAPFAPCNAQETFFGLADGAHLLEVRARDGAGNVDPTPASHHWNVDTQPPDTHLSSGPPPLTRELEATFTFSSTEAGNFECRLDAGAWSSCASPVTFTGLADGARSFDVRAVDLAGNVDATPASWTWTIDSVAPETTILSGPPPLTNATSATFTLGASEPGVTFECEVGSSGFVPCVSPVTLTGFADGTHVFHARASDAAGNVDPTQATYSWTVDTVPPSVLIVSGPPSLGNQPVVEFAFESDDTAAVFQCRLDGGPPSPCGAFQAFGPLADGIHQLEVRAVDAAGNVTPGPEVYAFLIDTIPPDTAIDTLPSSPTTATIATFTFSSPDAPVTFECALDGGLFLPCTSPRTYEELEEGPHEFQVRAVDAAGNVDPFPASALWMVDVSPPETTLTATPPMLSNSTDVSFAFTSNEAGATFRCALDGGAFLPCASPHHYLGLSEGLHTFQVRAVDAVGFEDLSPAWFSWTIDTTPPETSIVSGPPNPSNASTSTFEFASNEATATFECRLDGAPSFTPCGEPAVFSGLGHGPHGVEVRAVDGAGNADPSPAAFFWEVDLVPPETTLLSSPPALTNVTSATFTFAASELGSTFECRLDGAPFAPCAPPLMYPSVSDGAHVFDVRAVDPAGNRDPSPASHSWTVDTTPPETTILSSPNAATHQTTATFTFEANEAGATFECELDGGGFAPCTSPVSFSGLAVGPHQFAVRASDAFQTDPTPATFVWTIDQTPPDTTFVVTPANPSNQNPPVFLIESTEPGSTFECRVDGIGPFTPCGASPLLGLLADGVRTLEARAVDPAGNADPTPASYTWTLDTAPPDTTASVPSFTTTPSVWVTLGSNESPVTFQCRLDGGAWVACGNPATFTGLTDGPHVLLARAIDAAGNVDPTPASAVWTQDTVAPETTLLSGPLGNDPSTTVTFTFSASENATFQCRLDPDPVFLPCTSPHDVVVTAGPQAFFVRAVDLAGNVDPTPASRSWVVGADPDSDNDGIPDSVEIFVTLTDPNDDDSDDDGILDGNEDRNQDGILDPGETDPNNRDTDGDGIQDGTERGLAMPEGNDTGPGFQPDLDPTTTTDPRAMDSDGGGVFDGIEDANGNGRQDPGESDPTNPSDDFDRDRDGIDDATEVLIGTDPADADSDDDGVTDGLDGTVDTDGDGLIDALDPDSDNDGILDGTESGVTLGTVSADTDVHSPNFVPDRDPTTQTDPKDPDTDGDGLPDGDEDRNRNGRVDAGESSPLSPDTDGDGLGDFLERRGVNPTDPSRADTDGDGLADGIEDRNRNGRVDRGETDPNRADTDGDGVPDGQEVAEGTDPLDVSDRLEVSGGGCTPGPRGGRRADLGWGLLLLWWILARRGRPGVWHGALVLALVAPIALAENASRAIDLHRLRLGAGESDVFGVQGVLTTGWRKFRGAATVAYATDVFALRTAGGGATLFRPIEAQGSIDVSGSFGVTDRSDVSFSVAAVAQSTNVPPALAGLYPNGLAATGMNDARMNLKYRLSELTSAFRMGLAMGVALPTGDSQAYLGTGAFTFQPRLLGEYLSANGTRWVANLGADFRPERRLLNLTVGSELVAGLGVSFPFRWLGKSTRLLVDATGAVGLSSFSAAAMPFEMRAGARFRVASTMGLQVAVGRGLSSGYGTPAWRGLVGFSFGESTSPMTDGYLRRAVKREAEPVTPVATAPAAPGSSP